MLHNQVCRPVMTMKRHVCSECSNWGDKNMIVYNREILNVSSFIYALQIIDECKSNDNPYKNRSVYYHNTNYRVRTV